MSFINKPFVKIKSIYRKPRTVSYKGHKVVIKYKREKVKVFKCKHCDFKQLNIDNNGKYLKAHLTKVHKTQFIKGHSQQVKIQNLIITLSHFEELVQKELFWSCPFCGKRFIHTPLSETAIGHKRDIESTQIVRHLASCPKMTRNCTKKRY